MKYQLYLNDDRLIVFRFNVNLMNYGHRMALVMVYELEASQARKTNGNPLAWVTLPLAIWQTT